MAVWVSRIYYENWIYNWTQFSSAFILLQRVLHCIWFPKICLINPFIRSIRGCIINWIFSNSRVFSSNMRGLSVDLFMYRWRFDTLFSDSFLWLGILWQNCSRKNLYELWADQTELVIFYCAVLEIFKIFLMAVSLSFRWLLLKQSAYLF